MQLGRQHDSKASSQRASKAAAVPPEPSQTATAPSASGHAATGTAHRQPHASAAATSSATRRNRSQGPVSDRYTGLRASDAAGPASGAAARHKGHTQHGDFHLRLGAVRPDKDGGLDDNSSTHSGGSKAARVQDGRTTAKKAPSPSPSNNGSIKATRPDGPDQSVRGSATPPPSRVDNVRSSYELDGAGRRTPGGDAESLGRSPELGLGPAGAGTYPASSSSLPISHARQQQKQQHTLSQSADPLMASTVTTKTAASAPRLRPSPPPMAAKTAPAAGATTLSCADGSGGSSTVPAVEPISATESAPHTKSASFIHRKGARTPTLLSSAGKGNSGSGNSLMTLGGSIGGAGSSSMPGSSAAGAAPTVSMTPKCPPSLDGGLTPKLPAVLTSTESRHSSGAGVAARRLSASGGGTPHLSHSTSQGTLDRQPALAYPSASSSAVNPVNATTYHDTQDSNANSIGNSRGNGSASVSVPRDGAHQTPAYSLTSQGLYGSFGLGGDRCISEENDAADRVQTFQTPPPPSALPNERTPHTATSRGAHGRSTGASSSAPVVSAPSPSTPSHISFTPLSSPPPSNVAVVRNDSRQGSPSPSQALRPSSEGAVTANGAKRQETSARSSPQPPQSLPSGAALPAAATYTPRPLRNFGATCYMNATLQCIVHSPHLIASLMDDVKRVAAEPGAQGSADHVTDGCQQGGHSVTTKERRQSYLDLHAPASSSLIQLARGPAKLATGQVLLSIKGSAATYNDEFSGNGQNDAHEFLRTILYVIHDEVNKGEGRSARYEELKDIDQETEAAAMARWMKRLRSVDDSTVYDCFGGVLRSRCECLSCGFVSMTFDPFLDLSLPVSNPNSLTGAAATTASPANSSGAPTASSAAAKTSLPSPFSRKASTPLGRTKPRPSYGGAAGANASPEAADLILRESFCEDTTESLTGGNQFLCERCKGLRDGTRCSKVLRWPRTLVLHLNRFDDRGRKNRAKVIYPQTFMLDDDVRYRLFAVCCHSGTENFGHYTSYVNVSIPGGPADMAAGGGDSLLDESANGGDGAAAVAVGGTANGGPHHQPRSPRSSPPLSLPGAADAAAGAYARRFRDQIPRWFLCNDDRITEVDAKEAVSALETAYILFYYRQ